jgi:hypothetical protein
MDRKLLEKDKKRLCGCPKDQKESASNYSGHQERSEVMIVSLAAQRLVEQRERDEKERLEVERHQREENDRLEAEGEKEQPQAEQREQKERLEAQRRREEKELPHERAIPVPPREEKAPLRQTPKVRRILAACAGLAIVAVALVVYIYQSPTATKEQPFVNSLGMKFVAVPGTNVLFSVWETRVKDYQAFCDATGRSWEKPRFQQTADNPAVNVSWEDAKAFCEWLSGKEGKGYRLPMDHEWSSAVGIGGRENAGATPKSKDMKSRMSFRGANSGLRRMTREITSERSARQRRGLASLRRRDMVYGVGQLSKDLTMERYSRQRQEVSVRPDSAFMTWEGMSRSGARMNTNRARPCGCCAAARGAMATATACCRPSASTAVPIIAALTLGFVR